MTALTIVIVNPANWAEARAGESIGGVTITSDAFETVLTWFPVDHRPVPARPGRQARARLLPGVRPRPRGR
ncbi:hypothetical protein GCM10017668_69050 [Streptomyces tuirus]|uniref:Uncharacterized protein n=1 Tax=Streptomyces tuirus TaxID=68278 RepID=A0A7G1NRD2_9ACTN|nr:hypothetical protein GCM10017668_69050 [Streptomyces tuirus]